MLATAEDRRLWDRWTPAAVWAVWAALFVAALAYVARYGVNAPYYDGWTMVQVLDGARPVDAEWLWQPNNDHRVPLPKLALLALHMLAGWEFRAPMAATVALLAAASAALMAVARRARGRTAAIDVLPPLALLHWGHHENFLWGWQLTQSIPVALVLCLLALGFLRGLDLRGPAAVAAGLGVVALPLCGVPGLVYAPPLAIWLAVAGLRRRAAGAWRDAAVLWGCAAVAAALAGLYFLGLRSTAPPGPPDLLATGRAMAAFAGHGFGALSGPFSRATAAAAVVFLLVGAFLVARATASVDPQTRSRAWAMLAFLAGFGALALAVGVARPMTVFAPRYYLQAAPGLVWAWLAVSHFGVWPAAREALGAVVVLATLATTGHNYAVGAERGAERRRAFAAVAADIRAGLPVSRVLARGQRALFPFPEDGGGSFHPSLAAGLETLRRRSVGVFASLAPEPSPESVRVVALSAVGQPGPGGVWTLSAPTALAGVLLARATPAGEGAPPTIVWWRAAHESFAPARRYTHWWTPGETETTFWMEATPQALRIDDDAGTPLDVRLLLAASAGAGDAGAAP